MRMEGWCLGKFEWTALDRQQRLKVLRRLPPKLQDLLPSEDATQIAQLWTVSVSEYPATSCKACT